MKKLWSKKTPLWFVVVAVGFTAIGASYIQNVGADDQVAPWATTEYFVIRDLDLDTVNDSMHAIGKPNNDVVTLQTGYVNVSGSNKPKCASKCTDGTCDSLGTTADTIYSASATFYGTFAIAASNNNSKEGRIPKALFTKTTDYINPGKKMSSPILMTDAYNTGICYHISDGETWTMRKYKVTMD